MGSFLDAFFLDFFLDHHTGPAAVLEKDTAVGGAVLRADALLAAATGRASGARTAGLAVVAGRTGWPIRTGRTGGPGRSGTLR